MAGRNPGENMRVAVVDELITIAKGTVIGGILWNGLATVGFDYATPVLLIQIIMPLYVSLVEAGIPANERAPQLEYLTRLFVALLAHYCSYFAGQGIQKASDSYMGKHSDLTFNAKDNTSFWLMAAILQQLHVAVNIGLFRSAWNGALAFGYIFREVYRQLGPK